MISSPRTRPNASRIGIFSIPRTVVASSTTFWASTKGVRPCAVSFSFTSFLFSMGMPRSYLHKRSAFLTEIFHLVGDVVIGLRGRRVGIKHRKRLAGIGLGDHVRIERNPS